MKVLGVEDNDHKWERISKILSEVLPVGTIVTRAKDQFEGEARIDEGGWHLILLDISLDIRASQGRTERGGHDYTGGLKIAGRMYYLECEAPTIIVTSFDAFPSGGSALGKDVILGLEDVERQAKKYLGEHLIGTVRYGPSGWEDNLRCLLKGYISK